MSDLYEQLTTLYKQMTIYVKNLPFNLGNNFDKSLVFKVDMFSVLSFSCS